MRILSLRKSPALSHLKSFPEFAEVFIMSPRFFGIASSYPLFSLYLVVRARSRRKILGFKLECEAYSPSLIHEQEHRFHSISRCARSGRCRTIHSSRSLYMCHYFLYLWVKGSATLFWRGLVAAAMTSMRRLRRCVQPITGQVICQVLISESGGYNVVHIDIVIMSMIHIALTQLDDLMYASCPYSCESGCPIDSVAMPIHSISFLMFHRQTLS